MLSWFRSHRDRIRLLQSLQDEVAVLQLRLEESRQTISSKDSQLIHLREQNDHLSRRALEAESRRDSEGNGYRSQLDDMRKQMDWMARMLGKGPVFDRQLGVEESSPFVRVPSSMDEIVESSDPQTQMAWKEFFENGKSFLGEVMSDADNE